MQLSTYDKILNAAEELFAQGGYDAVSIRQITQKAGVRLALAHYHFGSKEALFNAVIGRRIGTLSNHRIQLLTAYLDENRGAPLPLPRLVEAFIAPYLYLSLNGGESWRHYARLVAGLLTSNLVILNELFDTTARTFLNELRRSMPGTNETAIQWGFDFMVGVMCNTFAEVDRISSLSEGRCSTHDIDHACRHMITFISAGLMSLGEKTPHDFSGSFRILSALCPESGEPAETSDASR